MRRALRAALLSGLLLPALPGVATAAPCGPNVVGEGSVRLFAPDTAADGRTVEVGVSVTQSFPGEGATDSLTVTMRRGRDGAQVYARTFTSAEVAALGGGTLAIPATPRLADGRLSVAATYTTAGSQAGVEVVCTVSAAAAVTPVPGRLPTGSVQSRVGPRKDAARFRIGSPVPCRLLQPGAALMTVARGGRRVRFETDLCAEVRVTRRGRLAGLAFRTNEDFGFLDVRVEATGKRSFVRRFRVRLRSGATTILDRWLLVRQDYEPARRVVQGTNAFIRFCLGQDRKIRSAGGRLFCDRPGTYERRLSVHRRKPKLR